MSILLRYWTASSVFIHANWSHDSSWSDCRDELHEILQTHLTVFILVSAASSVKCTTSRVIEKLKVLWVTDSASSNYISGTILAIAVWPLLGIYPGNPYILTVIEKHIRRASGHGLTGQTRRRLQSHLKKLLRVRRYCRAWFKAACGWPIPILLVSFLVLLELESCCPALSQPFVGLFDRLWNPCTKPRRQWTKIWEKSLLLSHILSGRKHGIFLFAIHCFKLSDFQQRGL